MCKYFSCIVLRDTTVLWSKQTNSHNDLISQNKLKDDKLENRDFVKIEIMPKDKTAVTRDKKDWNFKVDEEGTLPVWYTKNQAKYEKLIWTEWKKSISEQIALKGEEKEFLNCFGFSFGAKITIKGNSTVEAWDNSTVDASGNSTVEASGNSIIIKEKESRWNFAFKGKITVSSKTAQIIQRK